MSIQKAIWKTKNSLSSEKVYQAKAKEKKKKFNRLATVRAPQVGVSSQLLFLPASFRLPSSAQGGFVTD